MVVIIIHALITTRMFNIKIQKYKNIKTQKSKFSKTFLGKSKMDIKKHVQNHDPQKSLPKNDFFLS
jgi:hypothetical protein